MSRLKSNNVLKRRFLHVKTGDFVVVIAGNDRNRTGEIIDVDCNKFKVKVSGINLKMHYEKKNGQQTGSMKRMEGWIHSSNVKSINKEDK